MKFIPINYNIRAKWLRRFMNIWPPFVGAGITVIRLDEDFLNARVRMKLHWYNRNYMGTQYGGSLYSMTDAFYAIMILRNIGSTFYVWDKCATIDYISPARGTVYASYQIDDCLLETIRKNTAAGQKFLYELPVDIVNENKQLICKVTKVIYIRKKPKYR